MGWQPSTMSVDQILDYVGRLPDGIEMSGAPLTVLAEEVIRQRSEISCLRQHVAELMGALKRHGYSSCPMCGVWGPEARRLSHKCGEIDG